MYRRRWLQILLCLLGLAVITYGIISLYLPSPRWLIVGVKKRSGDVRMVQQHITFLPPLQYYRLKFERRGGWAQRDGMITIQSQEGVPVTVNFRLRFGIQSNKLADARRIVDEGFNSWIRRRVSEAVSAVVSKVPIEELLSPTSQFNARRDILRRTVANHLARNGLNVTGFEIAHIDADRDALLRVKRAELRRDARSMPTRVAVFAIDGADWDLLHELSADGRLPNLSALISGGASTSLQTIQPTVSPMIWTTAATGLTPDRHGVVDFTDQHHGPIDAHARRAPAVWDIADAFGRQPLVTNWWTAWPPGSHSGGIFYDTPAEVLPGAIFPPALAARADALDVPPNTIEYAQARRFLNISEAEWNKGLENPADPIAVFRDVLAKTWGDHRVAINLYNDERRRGRDPQLIMMSYDGADAVNHLFGPFHPPLRDEVSSEGYRKFWPAVANYYAELDRLIGEWMGVLPRDTTVMIVSGYGFRWGKDRPRRIPSGIASLADHRNPGVFIAYGPHVAAARGFAMSVYDVTPTLLTLLGLPKSLEMPGNFAKWAFRDIVPLTSVRVVSYGEFAGEKHPMPTAARVDPKEYQRWLQAIGHISDPNRSTAPMLESEDQPKPQSPLPPDKWGAYAAANNNAVQLRAQGKLKEATEGFQAAIELNPSHPTPYLNLAMVLFDRQDYTDADTIFLAAVARGLPNAEQWFIDFAALYRQRDMPSRAIAVLAKGRELFPQSFLITANLGSALVSASRYTEGVPELERALGMQPSSTMVFNNLGLFYAKRNDYGRALDYWNRSLSIEPQQPRIREAAEAARSRL